jgi:MFS transporter, FHS family, L-fucose permease
MVVVCIIQPRRHVKGNQKPSSMPTTGTHSTTYETKPVTTARAAMAMLFVLFFTCGFLAALNDILIPHLKSIFDLNYAEVMLVQFSFFSAFLIFALPSGKLIEVFGHKKVMILGLMAMGIGALLFIPAANIPSFPVFLCAILVLAGGITALQVSGNPYVANLGSAKTASSRLTLTQASNSLGSTIAPYFGGLLILSEAPKTIEQIRQMSAAALQQYRLHEAAYVKGPYIGIAITLFLLSLITAWYRLPSIQERAGSEAQRSKPETAVWQHRHLVLGAIGIFLAVGAEVAIGSFLVNYFIQADIGGLTPKTASAYVSLYWFGSMAGRFIGSAVMQKIPAPTVLGVFALVVLGLLTTSILSYGKLAMWSILFVGCFNSIMFPSIFTMGIANLGSLTSKGSGILMSAAVGGAIVPVAQGALADRIGVHEAFILSALCYVYVAFYGFQGWKPTRSAVTVNPWPAA